MANVVIRGDGVAACCCAHLLANAGCGVAREHAQRSSLPAVMLSDHALTLIRDVFEASDLFAGAGRIRQRVVSWGPHAKRLMLPHAAAVVSEQWLLESLRLHPLNQPPAAPTGWTIFASRPLPPSAIEHHFGSRLAFAGPVKLKETAPRETCFIESLENGWLFLIPGAEDSGSLISVGAPADAQLARSRIVAEQVAALTAPASEFPAYPRIVSPLCGPGWLACGSAAMAFDPICGDGTAHAIREAILASAVIRAAGDEENTDQLLAHYEARLAAGFRRHLSLCQQYYRSGGDGPWWQAELAALGRGIEWCDDKLRSGLNFQYRLDNFELSRIQPA
jgi:hypothetical protein